MARFVVQYGAGLSEFVGLPTHQYGDCGEDATLMALHSLWPALYPLTPTGLGTIDRLEEEQGYAAAGGAQNIPSMDAYLTKIGISHSTYGYNTVDVVDKLHYQLRLFLEKHYHAPVIVEYSEAGEGFPDDEPGVKYHFNTFLGEDDSAPAPGGYVGGYLRGDGDSRTDSTSGATTPLILTPWAEIQKAVPIAYIVIHAQTPDPNAYDRIVNKPTVVR